MSRVYVHSASAMGTVVTIQVVGHDEDVTREAERRTRVERAAEWFQTVESCFSRFDERSEVRRLSATVGAPVPVSPMLFETVRFARTLAAESGGAFDPTIGAAMETAGFDRHFRTGHAARAGAGDVLDTKISYRDLELDSSQYTITLRRPLVLDLGAVAKGLAVDMAAHELAPLRHFAIDAGGDLYLSGHNEDDQPWSVGIRHPRPTTEETGTTETTHTTHTTRTDDTALIETVRLSDAAVCTSGDYERRGPDGHHLLDPRTGRPAEALASVTVIAASAMVADAMATAAFVLGPADGLRFLVHCGVAGLLLTPALDRLTTPGFPAIPSPR